MGWLGDLQDDMERAAPGYGFKILAQLFLTYFFFCKALAYGLVLDSWIPYMKDFLGTSGAEVTDFYTVVRAPWAMKPMWAVLSDSFPVLGYRKRYNILMGVSLSVLAMVILVFVKPETQVTATFCFFLFVLGTAVVDSMSQARYTELMQASGNASIVSFVWFLLNAGGFLGFYNLLLEDSMTETLGDFQSTILVAIALPISVLMVYPAAMNWLAEEQLPTGCAPNYDAIKKHPRIFVLSCITAGVAFGGVLIQLWTDRVTWFGVEARWINGVYYMSGAALILTCCQFCLPRNIALPAIYMFMCKGLYLNINYLLQYYYTAPSSCLPEKSLPGFGTGYYQTVSSYGGTVASLTGVVVFDRTVQFWNVRAAFWVTTFVNCFTSIFDLMLIERWNQGIFGYDVAKGEKSTFLDQSLFILGAQAIDRLLDMLDSLPQTVLIGKLCPKGMEAQVFAVLAALSNYGNSVASVNGAIVSTSLGLVLEPGPTKDDPWTCANPDLALGLSALAWCKILACVVLPLCTIPFTWICLPNVLLTDDMLGDGEEGGGETAPGNDAARSFNIEAGGQQPGYHKSGSQAMWIQTSKASLLGQAGGGKMMY